MANILKARVAYGPFEYEKAHEYWFKQSSSFWLHTEVQMSSDVNDFHTKLTPAEKNIIGNVLKSFTQSELFIQEYWGKKVFKWFKKPEIQMMASAFSYFESIHAVAYSYLEETLNLQDYQAFLQEPTAKAKIDRLIGTDGKSIPDIAKSLAVFSAFNEGVNLFSSFAILLSFSQRNLLKNVGKIIEFSIRDESLHSEAGCWLFRTLMAENPDHFTDELKKEIYDAARLTISLEDAFIDKAFELGDIEGMTAKDLKNYIRFRANCKLQDLGLKSNWKNLDKESLDNLKWFDVVCNGTVLQDFFANRETSYSKSVLNFDNLWEDNDRG